MAHPTLHPHRTSLAMAIATLCSGAALAQPVPASTLAAPPEMPREAAETPGATPVAPPAEGVAIERVVVRARGRDETQQGVPMSVKAFSSKAIHDAGISKPGDFIALTPNVSLAESQSVGTSFMTIRGLTQVRNSDAPVAVVVDGVTQTSAQQFNQELFDIQSIEVLRGPQGALYGRNASGGAILITTKAPTNVTRGYVAARVGNGRQRDVQAGISGPIIDDKLLYRIAGNRMDIGGFLENAYLGRKADPLRSDALRADLRWSPTDRLQIDLRGAMSRDRAGALNFVYQPQHLGANCSADLSSAATIEDGSRSHPDNVVQRTCTNNPGRNTRDLDDFTIKAEYDLPAARLDAIYSMNKMAEYIEGDEYPYTASRNIDVGTLLGWGFPFSIDGTQTQFIDAKSHSLELRLTSPTGAGLRWMAGIYALKTDRFISSAQGDDNGLGILHLTRDPAPADPVNPTKVWLADDNHNLAKAAFGNVDYDITQSVEASLAVRYDSDRRKQIVDARQFAFGAPTGVPPGCGSGSPEACTRRETFEAWQPKFSLRHKASDGATSYASWGKGFRSGLFNQSGVAELAASSNIPGVSETVQAELTESFEVGYKTEFYDGKLRINLAVFDTQVRNSPYYVFVPALGAQVMVGIDEVHLSGGEFEAAANLAKGLDAGFGIGVTRSRIKEYRLDPLLSGNWAPYVPRISGNLGLQYRFPFTAQTRLMLRGDLVYKGKQFWDPENTAARSALTLMNARAVLEDSGGKWTASLGVDNIANKAYNAEWVLGGFANPAVPRRVRADARINF